MGIWRIYSNPDPHGDLLKYRFFCKSISPIGNRVGNNKCLLCETHHQKTVNALSSILISYQFSVYMTGPTGLFNQYSDFISIQCVYDWNNGPFYPVFWFHIISIQCVYDRNNVPFYPVFWFLINSVCIFPDQRAFLTNILISYQFSVYMTGTTGHFMKS
jgi:hypothetical protein